MDVVEDKHRKSSVFVTKEDISAYFQPKGLKGDYANLCILILLYVLQGVSYGNLITIPMILSSNGVAYSKQAIFSFASYPYAMKLLWAPLVDSFYSEKF
ncbi:acetyl-coenzyme A transporter 1-like protein, partial [Leptotrombidium deliense]